MAKFITFGAIRIVPYRVAICPRDEYRHSKTPPLGIMPTGWSDPANFGHEKADEAEISSAL
jgi:hypothetical protein